MSNIKNRNLFLVYSIILICIMVFAFWQQIFIYKDIKSVSIGPDEFSNGENDLSYRLKEPSEDIIDTYSAKVTRQQLEAVDSDNYWMVIKRLDAQGYKVWWNDEFIGSYGDVENGRANIWNTSEVFRISANNIMDVNEIVIQMYSQYDIGITDSSIQIADEKVVKRIHSLHMFFSCYLTYISMGIATFSILLSAILMVVYKYNRTNILFLMCVMAAMAVYSFESLEIQYLYMPFLAFKRIVLISLFLSAFFTSFFVREISKKNYPVYFGFAALLAFLTGAMIADNMLEFKQFYNIAMVLLPLVTVVYAIALIPKYKTDDKAKIFLGGFITVVIMTVWEIYANLVNTEILLSSSYPFIMVLAAMLVLIIMNENVIKNKELSREAAIKEHYFQKSTKDELTGFYKRDYWIDEVENMQIPFSIAMIDIDDFKKINDEFGHQYGDAVIKNITGIIRTNTRVGDVLGRYGGDEFMVALKCLPKESEQIAERIRAKVAISKPHNLFGDVEISISIGMYHVEQPMSIDEMINKADSAMYNAKKLGKNFVSLFEG